MNNPEIRNQIVNSNIEFYNNLFTNTPDSELIHLYSLYFYVREEMIAADYYDNDSELRVHMLHNMRNMCELYYDRIQKYKDDIGDSEPQLPRSESPVYIAAEGDFDSIYELEEEEEGYNHVIEDYNKMEEVPGTYRFYIKNQTAARAEFCEQWINRGQ